MPGRRKQAIRLRDISTVANRRENVRTVEAKVSAHKISISKTEKGAKGSPNDRDIGGWIDSILPRPVAQEPGLPSQNNLGQECEGEVAEDDKERRPSTERRKVHFDCRTSEVDLYLVRASLTSVPADVPFLHFLSDYKLAIRRFGWLWLGVDLVVRLFSKCLVGFELFHQGLVVLEHI
jgi:hypothetical protein